MEEANNIFKRQFDYLFYTIETTNVNKLAGRVTLDGMDSLDFTKAAWYNIASAIGPVRGMMYARVRSSLLNLGSS